MLCLFLGNPAHYFFFAAFLGAAFFVAAFFAGAFFAVAIIFPFPVYWVSVVLILIGGG